MTEQIHEIVADWLPMSDAPKVPGPSQRFKLPERVVRAFWCNDLKDWVTDSPVSINRIPAGALWEKPAPNEGEIP